MKTHSTMVVSLGLIVAGLTCGCTQNVAPPADKGNAVSDETRVFEGVLQGGMMGIGGEHTGWVLEVSPKDKIEVDVRSVAKAANQHQGRRVRITGNMVTKQYVERGPTPVLVASKIEQVRP